ncbi:hypothetical protein [Streptomyces sp. NPDC085466]|uniref:protein kinase domain-containing protein n=1 Tax=Streptomyces sp. NPDC085466 TaxID=3365725 RepID=UPI0037CCF0BD
MRALGFDLVRGLRGIHHARVQHRDLKPSNVLLGRDGAKVIDFGIARAFGASTMTATGRCWARRAICPRSMCWAVGMWWRRRTSSAWARCRVTPPPANPPSEQAVGRRALPDLAGGGGSPRGARRGARADRGLPVPRPRPPARLGGPGRAVPGGGAGGCRGLGGRVR